VPRKPEARYAWEKRLMDEKSLMPLLAVPDFLGNAARLRHWLPAPWGKWPLADLWLETAAPAQGALDTGVTASLGGKP
jgi:hypothetical protein